MSGKRVVRESLLAARAGIPADLRARWDAELITAAVRLCQGRTRVAAYAALPGEPGGPALAAALADAAAQLLLPVLLPDGDLDWAEYTTALAPSAVLGRLWEPVGPRLGVNAIASADLVLVPALAVDERNVRLGRGGGSYDRALARVRPDVPVIALLYPDERRPLLPAEPHDRRVTGVLTPQV